MSEHTDVMRAVLGGTRATEEQYQAYYRAFHSENEAATEISLRGFRDEAGRDSYQRLADALQPAMLSSVLDVGCGNGPLLADIIERNPNIRASGIDLSEEEIARTKERLRDANIGELVVGDAAHMPFANASFAAVTSHMMLMLVPQLDPVLAEIRRVLADAGRFAFLVPRRGDAVTTVTELLQQIPEWIREEHPDFTPVNPGDAQTWEAQALTAALHRAGFPQVNVDDFEVAQMADAGRVWEIVARRYYVGSLPRATQDRLRDRVNASVGVGQVDYREPLRIVSARG